MTDNTIQTFLVFSLQNEKNNSIVTRAESSILFGVKMGTTRCLLHATTPLLHYLIILSH